jgi:pSer/pThr/pTyr-binding forkhead associated (FHA) protein
MSGDWRGANRSPHPQAGTPAKESPFMRTAYGYSTPNQPDPVPEQVRHPGMPLPNRNMPNLSAHDPSGYQSEHRSTPTSVLLPVSQMESQQRGKLVTVKGEQKGESWFLNRSHTTLGRALDNDIVLLDIAASRKHAQVIRSESGFSLLDLRSANGIFINGRRITEEELYDGDELEIGETALRFETVGQPRVRELIDEDDTDPGMSNMPPMPPMPPIPPMPPMPNRQPVPMREPMRESPNHQASVMQGQRLPNKVKKANHLTYGFGSKWSPNELNISQEEQQVQRPLPSLKEKLYDLSSQICVEIKIGQSRRANVMRATMAMCVILVFFGLGQVLRSLIRGSSLPTPVQGVVGQPTPLVNTQTVDVSTKPKVSVDLVVQELTVLINNGSWDQALVKYGQIAGNPSHLSDPRIVTLKSQAEQGLINQNLPLITNALHRGILSKAKTLLIDVEKKLSDKNREQLLALQFSLWLHERELGNIDRLNPPPREQRVLERAALAVQRGEYRSGDKILKKARPSKQRVKLFSLRRSSIQALLNRQTRNQPIKEVELQNLLGGNFDAQTLLQRYRTAIEQGVRKTQYQQIAPWLEGAILLSMNQPQLNQYFVETQTKLKSEAMKWLSIAKSNRSREDRGLNRALLEAAIPYLEGSSLNQAKRALRRLKRR